MDYQTVSGRRILFSPPIKSAPLLIYTATMEDAGTSASAKEKSVIDIGEIEASVEANVQRTLDTFDTWKAAERFRMQEKNPCTKEKHNLLAHLQ